MEKFDVLVKNARVIDGTGSPWYRADVGVVEDTITSIGNLEDKGTETVIDAQDKALAPGFIEIHGHSDRTLMINPRAESSIHLGVTTETIGNCGNSLAPITKLNKEKEQNSFWNIDPNFQLTWETPQELVDTYRSKGASVNIVPFIGHNTIREAVKGPHLERVTGNELAQMKKYVRDAMEAGMHGMTTGLEYPPGCAATTEEITELVDVVSNYGGIYPTHIRNRDQKYLSAIHEAITIARETRVPTQISHNVAKIGSEENVMQKVLNKIEEAREGGLDITFDVGPYLGGQTTASAALPGWAVEGGVQQTLERLSSPRDRERIKKWEDTIWPMIKMGDWDKVRLATSEENPDLIGKTFEEIASVRGEEDPGDVLLDILLEEGENLFDLLWEGEIYTAEDRNMALKHPLSTVCCDGRALAPYGPLKKLAYHHVYTWIPYLLRYHVKENELFPLEEAVKKLTSMSAQRLGLQDRGTIKPGMKADLVIFDPATIKERATLQDPHLYPEGIEWTLVNGKIVLGEGEHTRITSGRLILNK